MKVTITSEALLPSVETFLDGFSKMQWSFLDSAEYWDSDMKAGLVDCLNEIVRIVTTVALEHIFNSSNQPVQGSSTNALDNVDISLGDSISSSLAKAFQVPQLECESAAMLTALVESEVTQKVISAVSLVNETSDWPSEPAIFVTGSLSNPSSLRQMMHHSINCVGRYFRSLNSLCMGRCVFAGKTAYVPIRSESTPEKSRLCQSMRSADSVPSATEAAHIAANDIVTSTVSDLDEITTSDTAESSHEGSWRPRFYISSEGEESFASYPSPSEVSANQNGQNCSFFAFTQRQFEKMNAELKDAFKRMNTDFLVCLQQPLCGRKSKDSVVDFVLPGAVPEYPSPTPVASCLTKCSQVEFETIKNDINCLFESAAKCRMTPEISDKIQKFSRKLTQKLYIDAMAEPTHMLPMLHRERYLCDHIISGRRLRDTRSHLSPEVLYATIEDEVRKFVQHLQLFLDEDASEQSSLSTNLDEDEGNGESLVINCGDYREEVIVFRSDKDKDDEDVVKNLVKEFGSIEETLEVALSPNHESVDDAVVANLVFSSIRPQKSAVARFFSRVGKTFRKLFSRAPRKDSA